MIRTAVEIQEITPQENVPLLGYGERTHLSTGVHDPLFASCWWLEPPEREPLAWVVLDLCLISIDATRRLAEAIAPTVGLPASRLFISTTHTHSGPDVRFIAPDAEGWMRRYYDLLVSRIGTALERARMKAVPSKMEVRKAHCTLGVNRRDASLPVDTRLVMLSLVDASGTERARIFHYSCHLTVLGVDNYLVSADWLGPVRATLREELRIPVMYLQGAEGNVDPVSRGVLEMADPAQGVGSSFEEMERLSETVASSIRMASLGPPFATLTDASSSDFSIDLPLRYGAMTPAEVRSKVSQWKQRFAGFLGIPEAQVPEDSSINALVRERCRELEIGPEDTLRWVSEQFAYGAFLHTYHSSDSSLRPDAGAMRLPVVLLDFGGLVILGVPAEALVEIAFLWQARVKDATALVCGLFNGWAGYLPHSRNFAEPHADERYETISTVFAPEAGDRLLAAAQEKLALSQLHHA